MIDCELDITLLENNHLDKMSPDLPVSYKIVKSVGWQPRSTT